MTDATLRRGDLVLVPVPFAENLALTKVRPAVIVQNDVGNRFSANIIVAGVSSRIPLRTYPTVLTVAIDSPGFSETGLRRTSAIDASVIFTVSRRAVVERIGRLRPELLDTLDECLLYSLGLSVPTA